MNDAGAKHLWILVLSEHDSWLLRACWDLDSMSSSFPGTVLKKTVDVVLRAMV